MMQSNSRSSVHKKIGQWLREKRLEAGMTQAQLAKHLDRSVSFVGKYEAGQRLEIVEAVAITLELDANPCQLLEMVEG